MTSSPALFDRYRELQQYVGWQPSYAQRIVAIEPLLTPSFPRLIDDFYEEINRHPHARRVITGGQPQINRLKQSLRRWLEELFSGQYDADYVERRWKVGYRHVEIGLSPVYAYVALSRLRNGLLAELEQRWTCDLAELTSTRLILNRLIDLDMAIIEDAYQTEYSKRLQRSERLAALGQISGGIAHELRNPLNVVKTSVYYLLNARKPSPEKVAEHLQRIERQVGLADGVITSLSNFARMPLPDVQHVSVEVCLRETLENNPLAANVSVEWAIPEGLPAALADPDQLRIVFGNLIRNACDAMPQGGRLILSAQDGCRHIDISVGDTGVGIKAENLQQILEPLYSTKARGLGLGLAISRAILEKHGAMLSIDSQEGNGATFTVRLPAAPEACEAKP